MRRFVIAPALVIIVVASGLKTERFTGLASHYDAKMLSQYCRVLFLTG